MPLPSSQMQELAAALRAVEHQIVRERILLWPLVHQYQQITLLSILLWQTSMLHEAVTLLQELLDKAQLTDEPELALLEATSIAIDNLLILHEAAEQSLYQLANFHTILGEEPAFQQLVKINRDRSKMIRQARRIVLAVRQAMMQAMNLSPGAEPKAAPLKPARPATLGGIGEEADPLGTGTGTRPLASTSFGAGGQSIEAPRMYTGGTPVLGPASIFNIGGAPIAVLGGVFSGGLPLGGPFSRIFRGGSAPVPPTLFVSTLKSSGPIGDFFIGSGGSPIGREIFGRGTEPIGQVGERGFPILRGFEPGRTLPASLMEGGGLPLSGIGSGSLSIGGMPSEGGRRSDENELQRR